MRAHRFRSRARRGANLIEFALVSIVLIPMVFGGISLGMRLGTHIQTTQLARDACHMYARGLDFSKPANQAVVYTLGQQFRMGAGSGNAVVILSQVRKIYDEDCAAIRGGCGNRGRHVVTHRIVLGNSGLTSSRLASPPPGFIGSTGSIAANHYLRDGSVALNAALSTELFDRTAFDLARGEVAYIVETFTPARETEMFGWVGTGGVYSRAIF